MISKNIATQTDIAELRREMGQIKEELQGVKKCLSQLQTRLTKAIKAVKTDNE